MPTRSRDVYQFFRWEGGPPDPAASTLPSGLTLGVHRPTLRNLRVGRSTTIWLYLFWYLFSRRKYLIYHLTDGLRLVHVSHVVGRNPKFAFLGPDDFEIGPCWTHPDFRGRGLYGQVLKRIVADFADDPGRLVIFAEQDNAASLRGIAKAGFRSCGVGEKSGWVGVYRLTGGRPSDGSPEQSR